MGGKEDVEEVGVGGFSDLRGQATAETVERTSAAMESSAIVRARGRGGAAKREVPQLEARMGSLRTRRV